MMRMSGAGRLLLSAASFVEGVAGRLCSRVTGPQSCSRGGNVGDVARARAVIAKRFAQRRDMDPQRALVDDRVGPRHGR